MSQPRLTFEEAEKALAAFGSRGWRLGLDRMNAFVDELGLRDYVTGPARPMYFHVAGTNGKGSTTCFLQNLLHEHRYRVGACYSPYVYDVRERVQIGRDLISKAEFAACTEILLRAGERLEATEFGGPTEFEMKIAMGFLAWQRAGVDAVALETGMGGRLDATNVVDPACSIITSIGLDHTEYLGSTLSEIAREKAGIIKPRRPVVLGRVDSEVLDELRAAAEAAGSACRFVEGEVAPGMPPLGMAGAFQRDNAWAALTALEMAGVQLEPDSVARALGQSRLPGRMEKWASGSRRGVIDGAHNAEAARVLASTLAEEYPGQKFTLVWGMLEGHDPGLFLGALEPVVDCVVPMEVEVGHRSAYSGDVLGALARGRGLGVKAWSDSLASPILVTGSFYLAAQFRRLID